MGGGGTIGGVGTIGRGGNYRQGRQDRHYRQLKARALLLLLLDVAVDTIDELVGELIRRDDPHGEDEEQGRDDTDGPEDAVLGHGGLYLDLRVEVDVGQDKTGHHATQSHAGPEEDAGEGVDDAGDAAARGVLAISIISKYALTDELVDLINRDIEQKQKQGSRL